jgi:hypothetical protein
VRASADATRDLPQIFVASLNASANAAPSTAKTLALSAAILIPLALGVLMLVVDRCRIRGWRGFFTRQKSVERPAAQASLTADTPGLHPVDAIAALPKRITVCDAA